MSLLTTTIKNCHLSESVLEALVDDLNQLIRATLALDMGVEEDSNIFYEPFNGAIDAWVRERTDDGRLVSEESICKTSEEIMRVAGILFDELLERDLWFAYTYRLITSLEVKSLIESTRFITLKELDRIYDLPNDDDEVYRITGCMYKLGKKVKRIIF